MACDVTPASANEMSASWGGAPLCPSDGRPDGTQPRLSIVGNGTGLSGHAFISYVREDAHRVDRLQRVLEAAGVPVWRDTAVLWAGEDWRAKIRHAITDDALAFIACFSTTGLARNRSYQNEEIVLAIEQLRLRRPEVPWLIPVRFDECEIPDWDIGGGRTMASIQRADVFADHFGEGAAHLAAAVLRLLGRQAETRKQAAARGPSRLVRTLTGHTGRGPLKGVRDIAFSPDSTLLASAGSDKTVRLWEGATGGPVRILVGHGSGVESVAFSPDGRWLASAAGLDFRWLSSGTDKKVRVWDAATGDISCNLTGHTSFLNTVAFSSTGSLLASAGDDKTIRLWRTGTWTSDRTLTGHTGEVNAVTFSPDGTLLASAAAEKTVRLWDTSTRAPMRELTLHNGGVLDVAFNPDGTLVASAGADGTVRLWETATGARVRTLADQDDWVRAIAFSPDGTLLASGGDDKTIRLWETTTGALVRTLTGHSGMVLAVAFAPDGTMLASAGTDNTVKLWA